LQSCLGMIVKTLFRYEGRLCPGEVEVNLIPGIPHLQVIGLPDAHIKECGLKLRSALRSCGLKWPQGHQIVVNLRPSYFRKSSSGADLAIALAFLSLTGQLSDEVKERLGGCVVYGEISLDGKAFAPSDLPSALRTADAMILTGEAGPRIREGNWLELKSISSPSLRAVSRQFDWKGFWREPEIPDIQIHANAAEALLLALHCQLNVLVTGPQGTGKTTWARALYSLTASPETEKVGELEEMFGEDVLESRWRPCEIPHHSISALGMVGGGSPITPGVISRSNGGVLIMDEFLEFKGQVLEALREPVETGHVVIARKGDRVTFPASFQLVGTSNLCPCGQKSPGSDSCPTNRFKCRKTIDRLSGPVIDRFDILVFSDIWTKQNPRVPLLSLRDRLKRMQEFRVKRGEHPQNIPVWVQGLEVSHRRRRSLLRVARGLADLRGSPTVEDLDFNEAYQKVIAPMETLRQLFA